MPLSEIAYCVRRRCMGNDAASCVTTIASGSGGGLLNVSLGVKTDLEQDFLEALESCSR